MKVLYDSQVFDMQVYGGISRCFTELYTHLPADVEGIIAVEETDNVHLQNLGYKKRGETLQRFMNGSRFPMKELCFKLYYNLKFGNYKGIFHTLDLNDSLQKKLFREGDFDIYHPTFFCDSWIPYVGDKPIVVTVHDMITELYPQYFPENDLQRVWKKRIIPHATHFVAVSEWTKRDLMRLMDVPEEKITVIYHGPNSLEADYSNKRPFDFEYILYVGERGLYKNFKLFCRDCAPILNQHAELKVVCTGKPFNDDEIAFMNALGIRDRFVNHFVRTNQEFADIYHYALTFVYPSEYEGFGIPILEAYQAGCPVMLNNRSCFPEIAGDAAIYFEMEKDSSTFVEQFETLYHLDSNERTKLVNAQYEQLKKYSWEKASEQLAEVYRKLV